LAEYAVAAIIIAPSALARTMGGTNRSNRACETGTVGCVVVVLVGGCVVVGGDVVVGCDGQVTVRLAELVSVPPTPM